jgi:hypothetical protein
MEEIDRSDCKAPRHSPAESAWRVGCRCPDTRDEVHRIRKHRRAGIHKPQRVNAIGSVRMLRALGVGGWTTEEIGHRINHSAQGIERIRRGTWSMIRRVTADAIACVYDELKDKPGPSDEMRKRAIQAGWHGPEAWALGDIDDPDEEPSIPDRPARIGRGRLRRVYLDDVEHFRFLGMSYADIAKLLDVKVQSIKDAENRARREGAA